MKNTMKKIGTLICTLAMVFSLSAIAFAEGEVVAKPNLNLATADDIAKVEGMTPELAKSIVEFRQDMGDYLDFESVLEVDGTNPELLMNIQQLFSIEGIADIDCGC